MSDDDRRKIISRLVKATREFDKREMPKLLAAKDRPTRELAVSNFIDVATGQSVTEDQGARRYRLDDDGKPTGLPTEELNESDGIGGGTFVDLPAQPVGTEKGRIRARNREMVSNPGKAQRYMAAAIRGAK